MGASKLYREIPGIGWLVPEDGRARGRSLPLRRDNGRAGSRHTRIVVSSSIVV